MMKFDYDSKDADIAHYCFNDPFSRAGLRHTNNKTIKSTIYITGDKEVLGKRVS